MTGLRTIRPAAPHEREALGELLALLLEHHPEHPRFALAEAEGNRKAALGGLLDPYLGHDDGRVLVAETAGQLVGLVSVAVARRPPPFAEQARGQIEHLIVRPEERRRGTGRRLVEAALRWLAEAEIHRVELQVDPDNPEGQAFWRALGFEPTSLVLERRL